MALEPVQQSYDARFNGLVNPNARLDRLFTGCRWAEDRPISPPGAILIWSDIPNDRIMRYDENRRQRVGVPVPGGQYQWPHRRSPGPAGQLRTWRPARVAHRA